MDSETQLKCLSFLERTEYYDDAGEWRIAGSDWILFSGATLRAWAKVTEQVLGSGARVIMVKVGKNAGEQFADSLLKQGLKPEEMMDALEMFSMHGGWGKVWTKVDFQKQKAVIQIHNLVTARQTKANEPICHFISGYIAGVLGVMFDKNIECKETKCSAKNDSFCEFQADW
jgi:predicted hydrocarbon binding protein